MKPVRLHPRDQVPNHWLRSICRLPGMEELVQEALRDIEIHPELLDDIGGPVPRGVETAVISYISRRTNRPYAGAEMGIALDPRNSSLLTFILFNSTTLLDALRHTTRFVRVARPRARVTLDLREDYVDIFLDGVVPDIALDSQLMEFSLGAFLGALRTATGQDRIGARIGISGPRTRGQSALEAIYNCPVELGCQTSFIRVPASAFDLPIRDADAGLLGHLISYGEVLLNRAPRVSGTLRSEVERHVLHGMATGRPTLSETAAAFGLSERTFARRLLAEGASFREIISSAQLMLARAFLSDPNLSLAEVAHMCGFSDQSGFTQAYRRWTGSTPRIDRISLIRGENLQNIADGDLATRIGRNKT